MKTPTERNKTYMEVHGLKKYNFNAPEELGLAFNSKLADQKKAKKNKYDNLSDFIRRNMERFVVDK